MRTKKGQIIGGVGVQAAEVKASVGAGDIIEGGFIDPQGTESDPVDLGVGNFRGRGRVCVSRRTVVAIRQNRRVGVESEIDG